MKLEELIKDHQVPKYLAEKLSGVNVWTAHGAVWLYMQKDSSIPGSTHHNLSFRYDDKGKLIIKGHRI